MPQEGQVGLFQNQSSSFRVKLTSLFFWDIPKSWQACRINARAQRTVPKGVRCMNLVGNAGTAQPAMLRYINASQLLDRISSIGSVLHYWGATVFWFTNAHDAWQTFRYRQPKEYRRDIMHVWFSKDSCVYCMQQFHGVTWTFKVPNSLESPDISHLAQFLPMYVSMCAYTSFLNYGVNNLFWEASLQMKSIASLNDGPLASKLHPLKTNGPKPRSLGPVKKRF